MFEVVGILAIYLSIVGDKLVQRWLRQRYGLYLSFFEGLLFRPCLWLLMAIFACATAIFGLDWERVSCYPLN